MSVFNGWQSGSAALMALSITTGAIAPAPSFAQTAAFSDVPSGYWARNYISQLAQRNIVAGFTDGSFRPQQPVTRSQFAAMVGKAFPTTPKRGAIQFTDVPEYWWASTAIQQAYTTGFLTGYPGNRFQPNRNIPREQVLVALANGLNYSVSGSIPETLQYYSDANAISGYARAPIAAATQRKIVVNYPNVKFLNPTRTATRADVAAFIYQALVNSGQAAAIKSPYTVAQPITLVARIPSGTSIPIRYDQAERILVTKDEIAPLTLIVAQSVATREGTVLIPSGSQVVGDLRPAEGGSQFVARELTLPSGQRYDINATSEVITKTERVSKGANAGKIATGAAAGAGAAAAIQAVTGDRDVEVLPTVGGATVNSLLGLFLGRQSIDLVAIEPNTDLQLALGSDLNFLQRRSAQ